MAADGYADPDIADDAKSPLADGIRSHRTDHEGVVVHTPDPYRQYQAGGATVVARSDRFQDTLGVPASRNVLEIGSLEDMASGNWPAVKIDVEHLTAEMTQQTPRGNSLEAWRKLEKDASAPAVEQVLPAAVLPAAAMAEAATPVKRQLQAVLTMPQEQVELRSEPSLPQISGPVDGSCFGLDFLTNPPSQPQVQVTFNTGFGWLKTRYHAVTQSPNGMLSLVFDGRYDGDQFIPSATSEDRPLLVKVPSIGFDGAVQVLDIHLTLGCLEIVNLLIEKAVAPVP